MWQVAVNQVAASCMQHIATRQPLTRRVHSWYRGTLPRGTGYMTFLPPYGPGINTEYERGVEHGKHAAQIDAHEARISELERKYTELSAATSVAIDIAADAHEAATETEEHVETAETDTHTEDIEETVEDAVQDAVEGTLTDIADDIPDTTEVTIVGEPEPAAAPAPPKEDTSSERKRRRGVYGKR